MLGFSPDGFYLHWIHPQAMTAPPSACPFCNCRPLVITKRGWQYQCETLYIDGNLQHRRPDCYESEIATLKTRLDAAKSILAAHCGYHGGKYSITPDGGILGDSGTPYSTPEEAVEAEIRKHLTPPES